jgi:hypothetical protein
MVRRVCSTVALTFLVGFASGCRPQAVDRSGSDASDAQRAAGRDSAPADSARADSRVGTVTVRADAGAR